MANLLGKYYPIIFITIVVFTMASMLTFTANLTQDKVTTQQDQQTLEIIKGIFPEAGYYIYDEGTEIYTVYDNGRHEIGYAFLAEGMGYSGEILILVGLDDKETIKGITIIRHKETFADNENPTIRIDFTPLIDQFIELKIIDCELKKKSGEGGGSVDGITGGTESSKYIVNIVRETVLEKVKFIE